MPGLPLEELSAVRARAIAGLGWGEYDAVRRAFAARDAVLSSFREHEEVVLWNRRTDFRRTLRDVTSSDNTPQRRRSRRLRCKVKQLAKTLKPVSRSSHCHCAPRR